MTATAVRLVLAMAILAALGLTLGNANPAAAAGGQIAITSVCHDGDLIPVPGSPFGGVRGTFVITITNDGSAIVKGKVLLGYAFTQKGPMNPVGQNVFLQPGVSADVTTTLGASRGGLEPASSFRLTILVEASATVKFWANRTFSSVAVIPACDASF